MYSEHFRATTKCLQKYIEEYKQKSLYNVNKTYKHKLKLRCSKIDQLLSSAGMMLGNDQLRMAIEYAKQNVISKTKVDGKRFQRKFSEEEIQ